VIAAGTSRAPRLPAEALGLGLFAAAQTFVFFARRDRFEILLWWTRESALYVGLLWLKDLALAAAAFLVFSRLARATLTLPEEADREDRASRARHALVFASILAAGIALRWIAPRQIPPGVWADALFEAEGALRSPGSIPWLGGRPLDLEGLANSALVSNLYLKFCALVLSLFGRGDVGLLALSAIGGSLALPAVYWLAREVAGPRRALVAMALMAFATWPLVFSRWAWTGALLLPLMLSGAACALVALRTRNVLPALAAGTLVGLSLHTHPAAWAAGAGFAAFALGSLRRPAGGRLVAFAAFACILAFLPFATAFLEYPQRLGGRARDVSFLAPTEDVAIPGGDGPFALPARLLYNAIEYTGLVLWTGDPNPRHGLPGRPPFHPLLGIAVLAGAALSLRKARDADAGHRLVLFLAVGSLLAGVLGNPGGAPNGSRIFPYVGAGVIWAAGFLDRWVSAAERSLSARPDLVWSLGLVILFVVETDRFLRVWPEDRLVAGSFCADESAAGRLRRDLGAAPTMIDPKALSWPIVFETLASGPDPAEPVPRLPRRDAADLLAAPPLEPFWYVTSRPALDALREAGWRCARGVSPREESPEIVIARVAPAARQP